MGERLWRNPFQVSWIRGELALAHPDARIEQADRTFEIAVAQIRTAGDLQRVGQARRFLDPKIVFDQGIDEPGFVRGILD